MSHPYRDSSPHNYKLGARSCRGCHQRKVRCDRRMPCTNCSRGGITCVYPTKDTDSARKGPTLQKISEQLERLEILLSRFAESSQVTRGSTANCPGGESQTQVQIQSGANAKKYRMSKPNPSGSTWELLLDDERLFRHTTNLNIEPHNVSLNFCLGILRDLLALVKLSRTPAKLI